jgi:hypothetical protein
MAKGNQSRRHTEQPTAAEQHRTPIDHEGPGSPVDHDGHDAERMRERSRQQAMAARQKATRVQTSAGQANVMRLKKGNQARGGR